jgi:hypothetical protein
VDLAAASVVCWELERQNHWFVAGGIVFKVLVCRVKGNLMY